MAAIRTTWHRTRVDGRAAAYLDADGRPDGPEGEEQEKVGGTALFLHGWGLSHRAYRDAVRRLAASGVRVVAPALPGFSGTAGLPDDCTLDDYASWVLAFLDEVEVREPVMLVGHSFGGGVATLVAHRAPARVGALVLVNSVGGAAWSGDGSLEPPANRPLWDWGIHAARDLASPRRLTKVLPVVLGEALPNFVLDPRAFVRSARIARHADLTGELATLRRRGLPIVVVWARQDGVLSDASFDALRAALGDAHAISVTGGHNWLIADPAAFGEVMTNVVEVAERARWLEPRGRAARLWRRVRTHLPGRTSVDLDGTRAA